MATLVRNEIDARREDLKRRKKVLGYARKHHEEEVQEVADREEEIREERYVRLPFYEVIAFPTDLSEKLWRSYEIDLPRREASSSVSLPPSILSNFSRLLISCSQSLTFPCLSR